MVKGGACASSKHLLGALIAAAALWLSTGSGVKLAFAQTLITPRDLAGIHDIDALSVSPDGRWAVFQLRRPDLKGNRFVQTWHIVSTNAGPARELADGGEPMQNSYMGRVNGFILSARPAWSPDSKSIAYILKQGAVAQIWRVRIGTRHPRRVADLPSDVRRLAYSADGTRLFYLARGGLLPNERQIETEGRSGFLYDERFSPTYSRSPVIVGETALHVVELRSGRTHRGSEVEAAEYEALASPRRPVQRPLLRGAPVASSGGRLAWKEAADPSRQGTAPPLTVVAQAKLSGRAVICSAPQCTAYSIRGLWWRNDDELIFAVGSEAAGAGTTVYAWRPESAVPPRLVLHTAGKFTSFEGYEWECAIGNERLVCFFEEADHPRRLAAIDLDSGAVETLYEPNPDFSRFALGATQRLDIRLSSGVSTYGYLVLPPHYAPERRLPLVIVTYRCSGFLRGGTGDEYPIYPLAAAGFAVFCLNIPTEDREMQQTRTSAAYQKWARGDGDPIKHRIQEAIDSAVGRLDAMQLLDTGRIGMTGLSYGAETVHFALFNMQALATAIASGGEVGPSSTFLNGPTGRSMLREWGLGSPASDRWRALSVTQNTHRVRTPLLLNVADRELITALPVVAALDDAGRAVEMYVYPDEYHIKWQPAHRLAIYNRNIDWMNFWLRGVEDAAPAKAEQYQRWRAMRVKQCELFKGDDAPWYCRR